MALTSRISSGCSFSPLYLTVFSCSFCPMSLSTTNMSDWFALSSILMIWCLECFFCFHYQVLCAVFQVCLFQPLIRFLDVGYIQWRGLVFHNTASSSFSLSCCTLLIHPGGAIFLIFFMNTIFFFLNPGLWLCDTR